jgi:hypothetical protein
MEEGLMGSSQDVINGDLHENAMELKLVGSNIPMIRS